MINKMNRNSFHLPVLEQIWSADNRTVPAHIYHVDESELQTLNVGTRHAVSDDLEGQNTIQPSTLNSQFVRIVFENDIESITPGQSVVFYCGDNYTDVLKAV